MFAADHTTMSNESEETELTFWEETWQGLNARFKEIAEQGMAPLVSESVALCFFADAIGKALASARVDMASARWDAECGPNGNDLELTIAGKRFVAEGKHVKDMGRTGNSSSTATLKGLLEDLVKLCVAEDQRVPRLLVLTAIASTKGSWTEWERRVNYVPDGPWEEGAKGPKPWPRYFNRVGRWAIEEPELSSLWMALQKTDAGKYWERLRGKSLRRVELERLVDRSGDHARLSVWSVTPVFGE
jgi:hypothetical protein